MSAPPPRALRRLAGVLLALAVVPALAFAAAQVFVQSESEAQLAQIRDDQLDGLLFSVNQNAWDTAATWADRLAREPAVSALPGLGEEQARTFLASTPSVRSVLAADTALSVVSEYGGMGVATRPSVFRPALVRRLLENHALGYRKLEPVSLDGGDLAIVFMADGATPRDGPRLLGMVVDPDPFVRDVVMPKLQDVGRGGIDLGVFRAGDASPVATTAPLALADVERERPLWLLPAYTVGARVGEGSAEAAMRRRLRQSLLLLGGVTALLGAGAWVAWRGVRREIEVARLRETFVSNVSHELRTPLSLIRMYAESLALGRVAEESRQRYYDTIVVEAERLSRLVGNVLHFNRLERGAVPVGAVPPRADRSCLDVGALVAEIADRYRPVVERSGGRLEVSLADGLPDVPGDADALAEALVNLIDNAVKYGGAGEVVEVRTRASVTGVAVEVADRGAGIPAALRERVFEPFVRLQPDSADGLVHTAKGTGLGLALVHRIACAHKGTATVVPRAGGGSVFRITLPA